MPAVPVGTSTQNPGLLHQASAIYFEKKGLDRLMPMLYFYQLGYQIPMPLHSGKTIQMFRFNLPGQNTVPSAEGVNPNPIPQSSYPITSVLEQYSDYMTSSKMYNLTDINQMGSAAQMVEDLSYRAALSTDSITRAELDSNTAYTVPTIGQNFTVADIKANRALMLGSNVRPYGSGDWMCVVHPYVEYDIISDNTAGGFIDSLKYTNGTKVLNGEIGKIAGTRIMSSTNVNVTGTAPNQLYSSYIFGYQSFAVVPLAGNGPSKVTDPKNQRFKVTVVNPGIGPANPTGEVGTLASYWFAMATKITDPQRMRIVKCDASLV